MDGHPNFDHDDIVGGDGVLYGVSDQFMHHEAERYARAQMEETARELAKHSAREKGLWVPGECSGEAAVWMLELGLGLLD